MRSPPILWFKRFHFFVMISLFSSSNTESLTVQAYQDVFSSNDFAAAPDAERDPLELAANMVGDLADPS